MKNMRLFTGALFLILLNSLMISRLIPWIQSIGVDVSVWEIIMMHIMMEFIVLVCFKKIRTNTKYVWKCVGAYGMCAYLCYAYALVITAFVPVSVSMKGWIAILAGVLFLVYGIYSARVLKVKTYQIPLMEQDMNLVLLSDLHIGAVGSESRISKIVDQINLLKPDIVCISGDVFDNFFGSIRNPEKVKMKLRTIQATYGVYACLGNHDAGNGINEMLAFLEESNIILLNDSYVMIADKLILGGRLDQMPHGGYGGMKRCDTEDFLGRIKEADLSVIVMEHNPGHLREYDKRVDLILSGHTHNGQQFPANLVLKKVFECAYGHYRKDEKSPHIIVTSGAGTWGMPLRIGTSNEIVGITLGTANSVG